MCGSFTDVFVVDLMVLVERVVEVSVVPISVVVAVAVAVADHRLEAGARLLTVVARTVGVRLLCGTCSTIWDGRT